jgi:signal transduction histidine kinase
MNATTTDPGRPAGSDCPSGQGGHPLELFPIFRRIPRSIARDLVYTVIWNELFAVFFTALDLMFDPHETLLGAFWAISVFANCIGLLIHLEFMVCDRLFPGIHSRSMTLRVAYYTILPIFGVFAGYWAATSLLHFQSMQTWVFSPRGALTIGTVSLLISCFLLMIFIPRERAARLQAEIGREQGRVLAAEKQATLAQLKLLEAQVEPHFLYNTLANVVSLIDTDPATAKAMIDRLIAMLRGAAAAAGTTDATLAAQIEHLRAYLELMALRMGGRLAFSFEIPQELASLRVPQLLLQPLVENAIRHGLEPKISGGGITVAARREGNSLLLVVADTGAGFRETRSDAAPEGGLGLRNLRERLAALFGNDGSLLVEDNQPAGSRITLRMPLPAAA